MYSQVWWTANICEFPLVPGTNLSALDWLPCLCWEVALPGFAPTQSQPLTLPEHTHEFDLSIPLLSFFPRWLTPNSRQWVDNKHKWQTLRLLLVGGFAPNSALLPGLIIALSLSLSSWCQSYLFISILGFDLSRFPLPSHSLLSGMKGWGLLRCSARFFPFWSITFSFGNCIPAPGL